MTVTPQIHPSNHARQAVPDPSKEPPAFPLFSLMVQPSSTPPGVSLGERHIQPDLQPIQHSPTANTVPAEFDFCNGRTSKPFRILKQRGSRGYYSTPRADRDGQRNCGPDDLSQWWTIFHEPLFNNLICSAYQQSLALRQAGSEWGGPDFLTLHAISLYALLLSHDNGALLRQILECHKNWHQSQKAFLTGQISDTGFDRDQFAGTCESQ
jgi:hypothetical protein